MLRVAISLAALLASNRLIYMPIAAVLRMLTGPRLRPMSIIVRRISLLVIIHEAIMLLYWSQRWQRRRLRLEGSPWRLERWNLLRFFLFLLSLLLLLCLLEVHAEIDQGVKAHLLILLILRKFLRLVFLLLSRLLSLGGRLGKLGLGMHLLHLCQIGVPEIVSPIGGLAL